MPDDVQDNQDLQDGNTNTPSSEPSNDSVLADLKAEFETYKTTSEASISDLNAKLNSSVNSLNSANTQLKAASDKVTELEPLQVQLDAMTKERDVGVSKFQDIARGALIKAGVDEEKLKDKTLVELEAMQSVVADVSQTSPNSNANLGLDGGNQNQNPGPAKSGLEQAGIEMENLKKTARSGGLQVTQ